MNVKNTCLNEDENSSESNDSKGRVDDVDRISESAAPPKACVDYRQDQQSKR